jgi:hypothetical protein
MAKTETSKNTKASKAQEQVVVATPAPAPAPVEDKKAKKTSKKEEAAPASVPVVEEKKLKKSAKKEEASPASAPVVEEKKAKKTDKKEAAPAPVEEKKSKKSTKTESAKEAETVEADADQTGGKKRKRYFRCVYRANDGEIVHAGRYSGKKPKQAARKALTRIADKNELSIGESVTFLIQECTRGSRKKKYSYSGSRVNLAEPITVEIAKKDKDGNKTGEFSTLTYKRDNTVKKISLAECGDLVNVDLGEDVEEVEEPVVKVKKASKKTSKKVASKKVSKKTSTKKAEPEVAKTEVKAEVKAEVKTEPKVEAKKSSKSKTK